MSDRLLKLLGRCAAFLGFFAALWLFWRGNPGEVWGLMRTAGWGLVLAGLAHNLTMLANACDWQLLIRGAHRPGIAGMWRLVWIRESVNNLLPVARIGGEVVVYRMLRKSGIRAATALASLIVDTQLTLISQLIFTLLGIAYLLLRSGSNEFRLAASFAMGAAALTPVIVVFAFVQRSNPFQRLTRLLNHVTSGKLAERVGQSARFDRMIKVIWRRRRIVFQYLLFWQPMQYFGAALEIWIAGHFLGANLSFAAAVVFESLLQALSTAAFFVPGNLGVQEGGFILIGGALGLDSATSLALAGARRIRDAIIFIPGLFAWQTAESLAKADASNA
jgi:putative membrane protein